MTLREPNAFQPRRPPRRIPVRGFPAPYNPNLMGDPCELCRRSDRWVSRPAGPAYFAWTCQCCSQPQDIPLD